MLVSRIEPNIIDLICLFLCRRKDIYIYIYIYIHVCIYIYIYISDHADGTDSLTLFRYPLLLAIALGRFYRWHPVSTDIRYIEVFLGCLIPVFPYVGFHEKRSLK